MLRHGNLLKRGARDAGPAKGRLQPPAAGSAAAELPGAARGLPETTLRNIALEAVRVGDYYAEPERQPEVIKYIHEQFEYLLNDAPWMKKYAAKMAEANGLTEKYTVAEILAKKHEADGYDIFVQPHEAIAKKAAEEAAASREPEKEVDPALYGELQEGLDTAAAAAEGEADPVGGDELIELLEGCAKVGEVAAAMYCAERLESVLDGGMPDDLVDRAFAALKPLLRPSAVASSPQLRGPWKEDGARKRFCRFLDGLGRQRKERELARGGEAAEKAERHAQGEEVLGKLCAALMPLMVKDPQALACKRRGMLVVEIARLCRGAGLDASSAVVWDIVRVLEQRGDLVVSGRDVELRRDGAASGDPPSLQAFACDLPMLDFVARERLEKRAKRRKAREQGKASKRRRDETG